jgi:hypothetical protein
MGLPLPEIPTDNHPCPCGTHVDLYGNHKLNCKQWGARVWLASHNTVQYATAHELRHIQFYVVDNHATLRRNYYHLTSSKRGDLAVNEQSTDFHILSSGNLATCVDRCSSLIFISPLVFLCALHSTGPSRPVVRRAPATYRHSTTRLDSKHQGAAWEDRPAPACRTHIGRGWGGDQLTRC